MFRGGKGGVSGLNMCQCNTATLFVFWGRGGQVLQKVGEGEVPFLSKGVIDGMCWWSATHLSVTLMAVSLNSGRLVSSYSLEKPAMAQACPRDQVLLSA